MPAVPSPAADRITVGTLQPSGRRGCCPVSKCIPNGEKRAEPESMQRYDNAECPPTSALAPHPMLAVPPRQRVVAGHQGPLEESVQQIVDGQAVPGAHETE